MGGAQSSEEVDTGKMDNWQAAGQGRSRAGRGRAGQGRAGQGKAAAAAGGGHIESTPALELVGLTCPM